MILLIVNYHNVRHPDTINFPYEGIFPISTIDLSFQIDLLLKKFEFITLPQLRKAVASGSFKCLPEKSVIFTFDDGLKEQFDFALPVLEQKGVKASYFISGLHLENKVNYVQKIQYLRAYTHPSSFLENINNKLSAYKIKVDMNATEEQLADCYPHDTSDVRKLKYTLNYCLPSNMQEQIISEMFAGKFGDETEFAKKYYMTDEQICFLSNNNNTVGLHSYSHKPLSQSSKYELIKDLERNSLLLEKVIGKKPYAISYPHGEEMSVNPKTAGYCREVGLELGFTMEPSFNRSLKNPMLFSRLDTTEAPGGKYELISFCRTGSIKLLKNNKFRLFRKSYFDEELIVQNNN